MESLRVLPSVLQTVEVPPSLSVTRLASSGDCRLKAILPPSAYPDWPPSPEAAFGRVVHSLMDLAARGQIQSTSNDAGPIASALDQLLRQEEMRLARAPIKPIYTDLQAALGPREWLKRRSLAIARTRQVLASRPCSAREFEPSQIPRYFIGARSAVEKLHRIRTSPRILDTETESSPGFSQRLFGWARGGDRFQVRKHSG